MLLEVVAGLAAANVVEWVVHKYVLHDMGKKKGSFWSYHWHEHHRNSRKHDFYDDSYNQGFFSGSRLKENVGIFGLALIQTPLIFIAPWYVVTTWAYAVAYLWAHRKSHLDVEWGKKWLPWHYDHHMGKDQDQNWCVLFPWMDWVMRTRKKG